MLLVSSPDAPFHCTFSRLKHFSEENSHLIRYPFNNDAEKFSEKSTILQQQSEKGLSTA